jgi:restriction system protein
MGVPNYQELMLPVLQVLNEHGEMHRSECARLVAEKIGLSPEDTEARLPSGKTTYINNRCGWARWYMLQAGLLDRPKRGYFSITAEGKTLLARNPSSIDNKTLEEYPSFVARVRKGVGRKSRSPKKIADEPDSPLTPHEQIEKAEQELNNTLGAELCESMGKMDPYQFEQLVIDLLFAMGYGGSREEAAQVTPKGGDGGIDGIINEDRLGLDVIYVQAKRWQSNVGRPDIQNFVGALAGKQATKGVFITTSDFASGAKEYAETVTQKVILIDGSRLADLMIEHDIGVSTVRTIAIKRIDSDYFEGD